MPQALDTRQVVRFGSFEVDQRNGEVRKQGMRVKLQDKPFRVLSLLLEHPGEVVTREEFRKRLWPSDTFVDFDHSLSTAVKKLRDVLGDSAENPRFVETVPLRGYRFNAPVVVPTPRGKVRTGRLFFFVLVGLSCVLLVSAFALIFGGWREGVLGSSNSGPRIRSIAVLPLENLSHDPEQAYFSDGITDALITDLSKVSALRVISRTSSMRYKGTAKTLPQIARELNVDAVVEGSVMRSGNRVRITAQLLDARKDKHLWAESYERDVGDILKLQSEVAQTIAKQVRVELTPQQKAHLGSAKVVRPDAYYAYLQGRTFDDGTLEGILKAQRYFEEAVQRDSEFPLAYVGLAGTYLELGTLRLLPPDDAARHSKDAISKAMALDDSLAEAHTSFAFLVWQYDWDWRTAEKEYRYALQLNPNYVYGHASLAWFLGWLGRRDEALAEVAKVRELDPAQPFTFADEGGIYYHARDYPALLQASRKSVALNPQNWVDHYFLGVAYDGLHQPWQAIPEYEKAVEFSGANTDTVAGLAHAFAAAGQKRKAKIILHQLERKSTSRYISPYMIATIYTALGNKDLAFEFLRKSYREKSPDLIYFMKADLRVDSLRSDPRFHDLARHVGFEQ